MGMHENEAVGDEFRIVQLEKQIDDYSMQVSSLATKLAEQQQLNAMLNASLAEVTGHVLTLCRFLGKVQI